MKNTFENQRSIVLKNFNQITTRGDGKLEKGETFNKEDIDFGSASHLNIHQSGEVAGSQFNGKVFSSSEEVVSKVKSNLPNQLQYDQFGRCEITMKLAVSDNEPVGWSGVKSINEVKKINPETQIVKEARIPGGIKGEENGIEGTWYPEMTRVETGAFVVATNESGEVKNTKAKFEPLANIAMVPEGSFVDTLKTEKITLIIQKDRTTSRPSVLTMFPGENAPAFPAKIDTETYKADSLGLNSQESKYWQEHVFLKPIKKEVEIQKTPEAKTNEKLDEVKLTEVEEKTQRKVEDNKKIKELENEISKQFEGEKPVENKVKEGVDFVFEQNPELASIGTKEQYSEYLDKIFPESQKKDVVYRGTVENKNVFNTADGLIYFSDSIEIAELYSVNTSKQKVKDSSMVSALINLQKPYVFDGEGLDGREINTIIKTFTKSLIDGFIINNMRDRGGIQNQFIVFKLEQIHMLGTKEDIEEFKKFINKE